MTKEKYMALADFQTLWTNTLKPYIVAGFIAMLASTDASAKNLVLADGTNIAQSTFIAATEKGANSGVATLDATGKVPSSQLPSFVDDVIEAANFAALPAEGEGGKIYVTLDDNKTYRWGGSAYAEISASIALGETAGTAYEGSKGAALKSAYDTHAADTDIHVTAEKQTAWNAKYDKPQGGIPKSDLVQGVQDSLDSADSAIQGVSINGNEITPDSNNKVNLGSNYVQDANYVHTDSNFTAAEKTKLGGIAEGAQVNVIETVKVNGTALTPDANKAVNVEFEIPERVTAEELAAFVV